MEGAVETGGARRNRRGVLTLPRSTASIDTQVEVDEPLVAPLDVNDVVGRVTLLRDGEVVSEVPLGCCNESNPRVSLPAYGTRLYCGFSSYWVETG